MPIMGTVIPESEIRVRLESVRIGQILTCIVCAGAQAYALATWDRPHRALLTELLHRDVRRVRCSRIPP